MTFTLAIFLVGSVLCCWSLLRCMGNERERRLVELQQRLTAEIQAVELPALPPPEKHR